MKGFLQSETRFNLMRAFAGETQAMTRYTFAAETARQQKLQAVSAIFLYTAGQEQQHAKLFFDQLKPVDGQTMTVDGGYPVGPFADTLAHLRAGQHNEAEEAQTVYPSFAQTAEEEGFLQVAETFRRVAAIEKTHGERFAQLADWLESGRLFVADSQTGWVCLNCGHVLTATSAPEVCPVCHHDQGYFIRLTMAPYTAAP